jgi:ribonucleoside-diphosphate reductase alpha chain
MATRIDQSIVDFITQDQDNEKVKDLDKYYGDDSLAKDIIKKKYLAPYETCPFDMWVRLAWACAQAEKEDQRMYWAREFYNILFDFTFVPGGRILAGLGRDDINVSFSNCYVVPIEDDSLSSIYDCLKNSALTFKMGGGVGTDLTVLRPEDDLIKGTNGKSCGSVGFANLFSISTNTVAQRERRGALMLTLSVEHPDIEKFLNIKNDAKKAIDELKRLAKKTSKESAAFKIILDQIESYRKVQHANISVKISDDFMYAVNNNQSFNLIWNCKVYKTVNAKELWNKIVQNAHACAEPGILFWDRMRETNNLEYATLDGKYAITCTNPCGEIPLNSYGSCLLGSNNLTKFIKCVNNTAMFDFDKFDRVSRVGTRFLDNVITLGNGRHALKKQNDVANETRRIGYGATGLGDALIMLGQKYGSQESVDALDSIFQSFRNTVYDASSDLALEKGTFPAFDKEVYLKAKFIISLPQCLQDKIQKQGLRGSNLLTIAPNGSLSIICQTSSGVEPIFRTYYKRKVKNSDGISYTTYKVYHPLINKLFSNEDIPDYVVDSSQIAPKDRVAVQSIIQKYIDNSISSTVNLPKTATVEDVSEVYVNAHKMGLKGVTVYVAESREGILLENDDEEQASVDDSSNEEENVKVIIKDCTNAMKRPTVLQGETFKHKVDLAGSIPYHAYFTINFEPGTRKPYELLITETNSDKEFKDIMQLEAVSRLISLCLRHNVPICYIVEQLRKVKARYIYSLPTICSNILENYIEIDEDEDNFNKCVECGGTVKREGGCDSCTECGFSSKCG